MFIRKIFLLVLLVTKFSFSQKKKEISDYANTITSKELMENLYVYSSDYFQGRETGTIGQKRAVNFLKDFYIRSGIINARGTNNYFQPMILNIRGKKVETENVAAIIKGSQYPEEYIILTAHLDHIGIDKNGFINNGADDDGTGNVALLEIAEAFIKAKNEGIGPKRSLVFLHVTGEEKGLLGSKFYTENPLYPLKNTVANLNIDMIGRINPKRKTNDPNYIYLIGSDKLSKELHDISEHANEKYVQLELDYTYNDDNDPNRFYYRSDHYNFAKNGIPVIFYFSGTHEDYHQPTDTPDKIEYDLLEMRTKLIFHTAWNIANREERLVMDEKPEDANDTYKHTLEEIKSFEGIYKTEAFPLQFKFSEAYGKLSMVPLGGSNEESLILENNGKNKFKSEMAGVSVEFKIDVTTTRNEVKNVSAKGMNIQIEEKTKKAKTMVLNISGNEIIFKEVLEETKEE